MKNLTKNSAYIAAVSKSLATKTGADLESFIVSSVKNIMETMLEVLANRNFKTNDEQVRDSFRDELETIIADHKIGEFISEQEISDLQIKFISIVPSELEAEEFFDDVTLEAILQMLCIAEKNLYKFFSDPKVDLAFCLTFPEKEVSK